MYIPKPYEMSDEQRLFQFIRENSFGILFSHGNQGSLATHLPFLVDERAGEASYLIGHMARANTQWRDIEGGVMVVFQGPHSYISPSWYEEPHMVSTWNYVVVHVYGEFIIVDQKDEVLDILNQTVECYESSMPVPWDMNTESAYVDRIAPGVVAFRIKITKIEGAWKLNQDKSSVIQNRVIRQLEKINNDNSRGVASLMRENLKITGEK